MLRRDPPVPVPLRALYLCQDPALLHKDPRPPVSPGSPPPPPEIGTMKTLCLVCVHQPGLCLWTRLEERIKELTLNQGKRKRDEHLEIKNHFPPSQYPSRHQVLLPTKSLNISPTTRN